MLTKTFPDGRIAEVWPLTFGRARVNVCRPEDYGLFWDDGW